MPPGLDLAAAGSGAAIGGALGSVIPGVGNVVGAGVGAAIGVLAPIIGDLIGRALASGDREKAQKYMDDALAQYGPEILKQPGLAELTPHLPPSQLATAQADPQAKAAQSQALTELQRLSRGDNIEFRGAMNEAEQAANQQARAQQGAVQQQMAARGMSGSGVDYALRQQAGQDAANRAATHGFNAAAEGRRQALEALKGSGALASTIRGQSWGEQRDVASAADEINRLNELGRAGAVQQGLDNRLRVAGARAGALGNAANVAQGNAAGTQQQWGNYGQGVGLGAGGFAQHLQDEQQRADARAEREKDRRAREGGA